MSVQPLEDVLSDLEFDKVCRSDHCGSSAEWMVWMSHAMEVPGGPCVECWAFYCDPCRKAFESGILSMLGLRCPCGYIRQGQLSDHFRAIKL